MDILWNYALTENATFSLWQHTVSFSQECSLSSLVFRGSLLPRLWECGGPYMHTRPCVQLKSGKEIFCIFIS